MSVYYGDRGVCELLKRRSRPVKRPIWVGLESVNMLFAILFQNRVISLKNSHMSKMLIQRTPDLPENRAARSSLFVPLSG